MKTFPSARRNRGLTLVEVLVILAVLGFLFVMLMPRMGANPKTRGKRIQCVNNLHQIGQAEHIWIYDHGGKFSFELSQTNGGTMEFTSGPNAWRHFQILSNQLGGLDRSETAKVLICAAESDHLRKPATNINRLSNSNLSYFIDSDSSEIDPQRILAGDRNVTNGMPIRNGIRALTTNTPAGWTGKMHEKVGNLLLSDGSVQQVSITGLRQAVENTGVFTNRFQMPILGP